MVILNFAEIGKFAPNYRAFIFAFSGIFAPVFRCRGLLLTTRPDFVTDFTP